MSSAPVNQPFAFTPGASASGAGGTDTLVRDTQREIAEIVREVATAVHSQRTKQQFLDFLADRLLRAMASEGVMIWCRLSDASESFQCVSRLGRITDETMPASSLRIHNNLISQIASEGQPVVVPGTPGCKDTDRAANPMELPAALVPIVCDPDAVTADYLLEAFLEPGCGIATQRGYLRFVAQMADLAGEFLRADRMRQLRHSLQLMQRVDDAIEHLHELENVGEVECAIVDLAVQLFGFDRVGLCLGDPKPVLRAVSHVEQIDPKSSASEQLRAASKIELDVDRCRWFGTDETSPVDNDLLVRVCVGGHAESSMRLICMQVSDADPIEPGYRDEVIRFARHADLALHHTIRAQTFSIPGWLGKIHRSSGPRGLSGTRAASNTRGRWKSLSFAAIGLAIVSMIALLPVPLMVHADAFIRPATSQSLIAPRNAVVDQIHVTHGQRVSRGQVLITLLDPALEKDITTYVGQRAVLIQEQSERTAAIVDAPTYRLEKLEEMQGRRKILAEEIRTIEAQLELLRRIKESLVLRARMDGIVDAWQIEQRFQSRPLQRGDFLIRVIADNSDWIADARVPQSRIEHIQKAQAEDTFETRVSLLSHPSHSFAAAVKQIGPAVTTEVQDVSFTAVLLRVDTRNSEQIGSQAYANHQSGAPARVLFRCGTAPAAYCLFQDLIRNIRGTLALHGILEHQSTVDSP